jgi:uncharacterized membrane protein YfcA
MRTIILSIVLGIIGGLCNGALGISGVIMVLPGILFLNLISDYVTAIGTSLFVILPPVGLMSVLYYYKHSQVNTKIGLAIMIPFIIASYFGSIYSKKISNKTRKLITAATCLIIGGYFIKSAYNHKD